MEMFISVIKYDINQPDWDMNHNKQVEETYGKVLKGIQL